MPSLSRNARFQNQASGAHDTQLEGAPWLIPCAGDRGEAFAKLTDWHMSRKACRCELFGFRSEPDGDSMSRGQLWR